MRLKREDVIKRETWVYDLLLEKPTITHRALQELLMDKFGRTMRFKRVQELRAVAATDVPSEKKQ